MRRAAAIVALALLVAAAPAAARPSPELDVVVERAGAVTTDRERYLLAASYEPGGGWPAAVDVRDVATGARRRLALPDRCGVGRPTAAGRALLHCERVGYAPREYRLLHLRTGAAPPLPRTVRACAADVPVDWYLIGRRWARGDLPRCAGRHAYLEWRTGRVRVLAKRRRAPRDLDDPELAARRICRRAPSRVAFLEPEQYDPPYFLDDGVLGDCRGGRRTLDRDGRLVSAVLSGGFAAWVSGTEVRAYDIRRRARYRWRVRPPSEVDDPDPVGVRLVRGRLFVIVATRVECGFACEPSRYRVLRARLPR